jgi:HD superfamily phosphohydrolase
MLIHDRIYGPADVDVPVLLDLLGSAPMQRLRGVLQHGVTALLGITQPVSRYEHSLGVMLLVRRLGGGLEEQVAALLHDVSHTAFSHVIDYVFDLHDSQSYHEEKKEDYVAGTELPALLARRGYDWRAILHEERYPLLEQPAPALCADRLDYFLRDSLDLGLATAAEVQGVLPHLVVHRGRIAVDDLAAARWLAGTFMRADDSSWSNFAEVGYYQLAADAIAAGLRLGAIDEADVWSTDLALWDKLHASDDPELRTRLALVSRDTQFVWDDAAPTFRVSTKLRTVDPDVLVDGVTQPLSTLDVDYARQRAEYLARKSGKWPMRVVP